MLAKATISRRLKIAKQFIAVARKKKLIADNPFDEIKGGSQRNIDRLFCVEAGRVDAMVQACHEPDWKLLLLLGRYGKHCVPSEVVRLCWRDVNFARSRVLIHCTKTARYEGKVTRFIPILDELSQPLLDAYAAGVDVCDFVIQNVTYRTPDANLRTQFNRWRSEQESGRGASRGRACDQRVRRN